VPSTARAVSATAAGVAQRQGAESIVNIHPAAGSREADRTALIDQSIRFFEWARHWCQREAAGVRPVAELQARPTPEEPLLRIGDSYDELLDVLVRSGCGACWDFGHAYLNATHFALPLDPPADLLVRVAHVHCHDADHHVRHRPLLFGNVPWRRFLGILRARGFDGTVILEVRPEDFSAGGGLDAVSRSIRALRACTEATPSEGRCG